MLTLSEWFYIRAKKPVLIAGAMIIALWIILTLKMIHDVEKYRRVVVSQLLEITSLALAQKNRVLIESVIESVRVQSGALSVSICDRDRMVYSSGFQHDDCISESSRSTSTSNPVPGFTDFKLNVSWSKFLVSEGQVALLTLALTFIVSMLLILRRVLNTFAAELVLPLKEGVVGTESLAIQELESIRRSHHAAQAAQIEQAAAFAAYEVAKQVSHDIRSPVSALNMLSAQLEGATDTQRRLIRESTKRISDIASTLLAKKPRVIVTEPRAGFRAIEILSSLIDEKKLAFSSRPGLQIHLIANGLEDITLPINEVEFSRMISNLLTNSVEACEIDAFIEIRTRLYGGALGITISDNGRGIDKDLLKQIGQKGFSVGKETFESGSGLGLSHAIAFMEAIGGRLVIQSKRDVGTIVTLTFARTG